MSGTEMNVEAERAASARPRDYLAWWTSIETDVRKSMLVFAHREPERLHALVRQAYEAGQQSIQAARRAAQPADVGAGELPELPERDGDWAGDSWWTADSMRQYTSDAIAADRLARVQSASINVQNEGGARLSDLHKLGEESPQAAQGDELAALRAEVREWLCVDCRTVYPGPSAAGLSCVICPKCNGLTGPRGVVERRALEQQVADLHAQLASAQQAKEYEQRHAVESEKALAQVQAQLARQSQGEPLCTMRSAFDAIDFMAEHNGPGRAHWALGRLKRVEFAAPPLSSEPQADA